MGSPGGPLWALALDERVPGCEVGRASAGMLGAWSLRAHGMGRAVDYEDMEGPRPKPKQEKPVRTKPSRHPGSTKPIVQLSVAAGVVVVAVAGAAAFFLGGSSASDDVGSPPTLVSNALDTAFEFQRHAVSGERIA